MSKTKGSAPETLDSSQRIETQLDERTMRELDQWRSTIKPRPTRNEAARLLLEESLCTRKLEESAELQRPELSPDIDRLGAIFALEHVSGFGPVKFRAMNDSGVEAQAAIENPQILPFGGRIGEKLRRGIDALSEDDLATARSRAADQLKRAVEHSASILVHGDSEYPEQVYASNYPVPVLYVRGNPEIWKSTGSVALVGSRTTRQPYSDCARVFASVAAREGIAIVSGFAIGADSIGHTEAFDKGGRTVCVMPCGLDLVFPPENRELWKQLLSYPLAAFVSEYGFGLRASSL